VVYHELSPPIKARYIRFLPQAWFGHISMRVELYGCQGTVGFPPLFLTFHRLLKIEMRYLLFYRYVCSVMVTIYRLLKLNTEGRQLDVIVEFNSILDIIFKLTYTLHRGLNVFYSLVHENPVLKNAKKF